MSGWFSQLVIGVIVTVVGTVIANGIIGGQKRHGFAGGHYAGYARHR